MNYTYYRRYRPTKKPSSFKSFFWLVVVLVIVVLLARACVSLVGSMLEENRDEASLTINEGSAQVLEWGQETAQPASDAQLLLVGDRVQTSENSIVTLNFSDGLELRLDENSTMTFKEAQVSETEDHLYFELNSGRVWVEYTEETDHESYVFLSTDTMDVELLEGAHLIANLETKQYVYPFEEQAQVDFVDREGGDLVVESVNVEKGQKAILTEEAEKALLARENIQLVGEAGDDFVMDRFVQWNVGSVETLASPLDGEQEDETETEVTDELTDEPADDSTEDPTEESTEEPTEEVVTPTGLTVSVTSPGLNVTIQKDAIAIEGIILSGTASTVTVTWAGNNQPYTLGGFAPGDTSFRYVADASYGNLKAGANTYTIVATAEDGTQSAPVTVTIVAEF